LTAETRSARLIQTRNPIGPRLIYAVLAGVLLVGVVVELLTGAVALAPGRVLRLLTGASPTQLEYTVFWQIRAPRAALAICIGGALGFAGAALQGLFRNPLADPSLIGVSSGAALAAVSVIVLDHYLAAAMPWMPPRALVPGCAFAGGLLAVLLALRLARVAGASGEGTATLLLAGIA
jgi:iron complex transport system permease protein